MKKKRGRRLWHGKKPIGWSAADAETYRREVSAALRNIQSDDRYNTGAIAACIARVARRNAAKPGQPGQSEAALTYRQSCKMVERSRDASTTASERWWWQRALWRRRRQHQREIQHQALRVLAAGRASLRTVRPARTPVGTMTDGIMDTDRLTTSFETYWKDVFGSKDKDALRKGLPAWIWEGEFPEAEMLVTNRQM